MEAFAASLGTVADLDAPQFAALRAARYACLGEVVADNLRAGRGVVAVAPFSSEATDAVAWRERALSWGATRAVLVLARRRPRRGRGPGRRSWPAP